MKLVVMLLAVAAPFVGAEDRFYQFTVDQDRVAGAADFSFLNRPLGPADRIFVCGPHFCRVGADLKPNTRDDERVRLFGVNFAFGANFPEEADAARLAKRLRRLGVNLVRLHHMDTSPDSNPENARSILTTGSYPSLNPVSVQRLRAFLDALAAEGIYVDLNLHVGYTFRPDVDKVPPFPPGMDLPSLGKPVHMFMPREIELQVEFARKLIEALKLKDDPVLAMVEINNESSLMYAWQRGQLQKYMVGEYKTELDAQYEAYLKKKGVAASDDEWLWFLVDRDKHYLDTIAAAVKDATGKLIPVTGTQVGFYGPLILDSHASMDFIDNHFYIDHYNFPHRAWDGQDWRIRNSSAVGGGLRPYLDMAFGRVAGKPYTVSEYNQQWPNQQAAELDPTLAAFAAFQDWDSIMHFAYSHGRSWDTKLPGGFDINGDWQKWPGLGQSAWLFRTGAVAAGDAAFVQQIGRDVRLRTAREKRVANLAGFVNEPTVAFSRRVEEAATEGSTASLHIDRVAGAPFRSSTGELEYDAERKVFTIAAPQAAGVFGYAGTRKITAGAIDVELAAAGRGFAAVLVTALDGKPIEKSGRMLLSNPGYVLATMPGSDPPRPQRLVNYPGTTDWFTLEPLPGSDKPSGDRSGRATPVWMERVESVITLRNGSAGLSVYPLGGSGGRLAAIPAEKIAGGWRIHVQGDGQAMAPWYEIVGQ